jgi:DGQHR domain-containing protein
MSKFTYTSLVFKQRDTAPAAFCLISAPVGEILKWARVDRLEPDNLTGVQRRKNESKTRSIRQFLSADDANTIPTALTIALPQSAVKGIGKLSQIESKAETCQLSISAPAGSELPGLIIDGQHRIFGINDFNSDVPVSAVLLVGADDAEIAFQFLVINNKVSKVSPDHMKALKLAYLEDDLDARLTKSARMRSTGAPTYLETIDTEKGSPFKGRLKWPRNPDTDKFRPIPPNAFEAALQYISSQHLGAEGEGDAGNSDFVVDLFLEIWRQVKKDWPEAWQAVDSRLLSKLGIVCFNQYLVDGIINQAEALDDVDSIKDLSKVSDFVSRVLKRQEYDFWEIPWTLSSLDTDAGRVIVGKDLKRIATNLRNKRPWASGLRLIGKLDDA